MSMFSVTNRKANDGDCEDDESSEDDNDNTYNSKGKPVPRARPSKVEKLTKNKIYKER